MSGTAASDGLMIRLYTTDGTVMASLQVPPFHDFVWEPPLGQDVPVGRVRINRWSVDSGEYNRGYLAGVAYANRKYREALKEVRKEISGG